MSLRTLMQVGPAKANDLFARLAETSDGALKTRERLFAELKTELEAHTDLEAQYLFPVLRRHAETKELVASATKENKELRGALAELDALAKNDETFLVKLAELHKAFRQHARDEAKELLPAVQKALSEEQVQGITEKMETSLAETEQAKQDQAEERRATGRREREQAEAQAHQEQAAEDERQATARSTREAVSQATEVAARTVEVAGKSARQITRSIADGVQRVTPAPAAPLTTGMPFWDMWLGMTGLQRNLPVSNHNAPAARDTAGKEQVIPLGEEVLTVGTRTVSSGTTRVRRYVVETAVEKQVALVHERVVVERRRPMTDKISGETLTDLTVEIVETDELPVVDKILRLKEEVVVRTERTAHMETVRGTVRQDEIEVEHSASKPSARRAHMSARV